VSRRRARSPGRSLKETGPCQAQGALRNTGPGWRLFTRVDSTRRGRRNGLAVRARAAATRASVRRHRSTRCDPCRKPRPRRRSPRRQRRDLRQRRRRPLAGRASPDKSHPPTPGQAFELSDDAGTRYRHFSFGSFGHKEAVRGEALYVPAPPDRATTLTVAFRGQRLSVELP
jgi:hypothetical protein